MFPAHPPDPLPSPIQRPNDLVRQRALLKIHKIALQMRRTTRTHQDCVACLPAKQAMMRQPPQRTLPERQPMLLNDRTQQLQRSKVLLGPIAPIFVSLMRLTAGQEAPRDRIERVELDAVVPQTREELRLYGAMEGVVFALVD